MRFILHNTACCNTGRGWSSSPRALALPSPSCLPSLQWNNLVVHCPYISFNSTINSQHVINAVGSYLVVLGSVSNASRGVDVTSSGDIRLIGVAVTLYLRCHAGRFIASLAASGSPPELSLSVCSFRSVADCAALARYLLRREVVYCRILWQLDTDCCCHHNWSLVAKLTPSL